MLPGQRIDVKVLLISADGTEPGFGAWKAELDREGVPYDTLRRLQRPDRSATLTDAGSPTTAPTTPATTPSSSPPATSATTSPTPTARPATCPRSPTPSGRALAKFERTFGIRQLSDYTAPTPAHGLNAVGGATQDGVVGTLTAAGKAAFPYLKGPVPIANDDPAVAETFGYPATPVNAQDWQTLLAGPNGTAYLGIYTHPDDGREEMVMTVASNEYQSHDQLLRHGDAQLGHARRLPRLPAQLPRAAGRRPLPRRRRLGPGDAHAPTTTRPTASRMTPADVAQAVAWSKSRRPAPRLRLQRRRQRALQGRQHAATDPLATAFAEPATRSAFGCINHTYDHPNLDCSTASFITEGDHRQRRLGRASTACRSTRPRSSPASTPGLANTRPGNPGTIDPPCFDDVTPAARRDDRGRHLRLRDDGALGGRRDDGLGRAAASPSRPTGR